MSSIWIKFLLPIIITVLFSLFIIPITLILIIFSRFLHRELGFLIHRYGRDNVVKIFLQGNFKGLIELFMIHRKERRDAKRKVASLM